jgi:hypothetical protein
MPMMTFHVIIPQRLADHFVTTTSRPLKNYRTSCGELFCTATVSHVFTIGDGNSNQHTVEVKCQDGGEYEIPLHPLGDSVASFVAKVANADAYNRC